MKWAHYVYILASGRNGTLYVGVTGGIEQRTYQHKHGLVEGFTKKYHVHTLVYLEQTTSIENVIIREKQLKKWNRAWKIELIEKDNPEWKDLSEDLFNWIPGRAGNDRSRNLNK